MDLQNEGHAPTMIALFKGLEEALSHGWNALTEFLNKSIEPKNK